jgi:hypothetical protein
MTATAQEVAIALRALGHRALSFPATPPDVLCAFVNVWHADDRDARYPADTVLAPTGPLPVWTWGSMFEHQMSADATAEQVAQAVHAGLVPRP